MEEAKSSPEQTPKSSDNLKQILIGIFLLSVLVYVTFGLVSKKLGWDNQPTSTETINPPKTVNKTLLEKANNTPPINQPMPSDITSEPKLTNVDVASNNGKSKDTVVQTRKQIPDNISSKKLAVPEVQKTENKAQIISPSKKVELIEPVEKIAPVSISGKWKTNDGETWNITLESENVNIRVLDKKNKYKNLMTGTYNGKEVNLTSNRQGTNGRGTLSISSDGKTMKGKIKYKITYNNYIITKIEN